jgi:hypothetical protein
MKISTVLENFSQIDEAKKKKSKKGARACWPGYKQVGWQKDIKGNEWVPKCVPEDELSEAKEMGNKNPCWDGYEMVGMKKDKNGKEVPNCVPKKDIKKDK